MKKLIIDTKTGIIESFDCEISEITPIWHNPDKPIRVFITYEQNALLMQSDYGIDLLGYFKSINPPMFNELEGIYIYLNKILEQHIQILTSKEIFGDNPIQINTKSNG